MLGRIFNIQHFSVHDGPGIRTVVFFKGCPLRCAWCANPESQVRKIQLGWNCGECIGCKSCVNQLGKLGCHFKDDGLYWNQDIQLTAEDAKEVSYICPTHALHAIGRDVTVEEVLKEVEKDSSFYAESGGGITLSGGEPLLQHEFVTSLLREAGRRHINRAMETTGLSRYEIFEEVASELDFLLMDVKMWSKTLHEKWTGMPNDVILENLEKIRRRFPELPILLRTPVIPGVNDDEKELSAITKFVRSLGGKTEHELLQYHRLGKPKYESLHRTYELGNAMLSDERFIRLRNCVRNLPQ
ncbi:glycyl-radical enzyme activating protein [Treponema zioleckii]|uniref:glycyl-radical enzyme activating protein n=1 Tax=Treponema zioleckii TaxID=331680 RepID=UPI00168A95BE|nr:glycyl-radical enzyme activating protein [Treponema zioleckii]